MNTADLMAAVRDGAVEFLTVTELARITRIGRMTIYRRIDDGSPEVRRFGPRCYRIPVESARRFIHDAAQDGT
jgi:excisionase family DNA binding protein